MPKKSMNLPKHIHVIGICGVATSALAIAFHKRGVRVTGSDKGFFPPVSVELEKQSVPFYAGWHPEKMAESGLPDACIVGTASGSQNPEAAYAKEHGIPQYSFAEAIGKFFARKNSIICSGTWGKTSSAALLSFILEEADMNPSYMFGGVSLSHDSAARLTDSEWSVFEGDEYKSSPTDPTAKFFYYKPTHLLLTAVSWDHADLYPTEKDFFGVFRKLLSSLPPSGFVTACADNAGIAEVIDSYGGRVVWYGKALNGKAARITDYAYDEVKQSEHGLDFTVRHGTNPTSDSWHIHSPMLGAYQAENITGCFAMASELGVEPAKIVAAISRFNGLRRRMEKRLDGNDSQHIGGQSKGSAKGVTVIDDIAHSPEKAASVLATLRDIYKGKIIAVFEPNTGGRTRESVAKYDNAFKNADIVVIPKLTKLKVVEDKTDDKSAQPMEGDELARIIGITHSNTHYVEDDEKLVDFLNSHTKKGDVIAFLGSHGFRGMIETVIKSMI